MSKNADPTAPPEGKKPLLALLIGLPIIVVLIALAVRAGLQSSWRGEAKGALADLQAQGVGIDGLYSDPPPVNGADDLRKAAKALENAFPQDVEMLSGVRPSLLDEVHRNPQSDDRFIVYEPSDEKSPKDLAAAVALIVAKLEEIDPLIASGLEKPIVYRGDWEKGLEANLDWLMEIKQLILFLEVRAGWRMIQGDAPGAYRDLETCLELSRTLSDPSLIGRLVQIAVTRVCVEMLEDLLGMGPPPGPQQHARIVKLLQDLEAQGGIRASLQGELYAFSVMPEDPEMITKDVEGPLGKASARFLWGRWRAKHIQLLAKLIVASNEKGPREFDDYIRDFEDRVIKDENLLSRLLLPAISKLLSKERLCQTHVRLALRGLRLVQRKDLPKSLTDMPKDPFTFDEKRCHYRLEKRGALLWSVGEDGVNSGGKTVLPDADEGPDDLTFRLRRK